MSTPTILDYTRGEAPGAPSSRTSFSVTNLLNTPVPGYYALCDRVPVLRRARQAADDALATLPTSAEEARFPTVFCTGLGTKHIVLTIAPNRFLVFIVRSPVVDEWHLARITSLACPGGGDACCPSVVRDEFHAIPEFSDDRLLAHIKRALAAVGSSAVWGSAALRGFELLRTTYRNIRTAEGPHRQHMTDILLYNATHQLNTSLPEVAMLQTFRLFRASNATHYCLIYYFARKTSIQDKVTVWPPISLRILPKEKGRRLERLLSKSDWPMLFREWVEELSECGVVAMPNLKYPPNESWHTAPAAGSFDMVGTQASGGRAARTVTRVFLTAPGKSLEIAQDAMTKALRLYRDMPKMQPGDVQSLPRRIGDCLEHRKYCSKRNGGDRDVARLLLELARVTALCAEPVPKPPLSSRAWCRISSALTHLAPHASTANNPIRQAVTLLRAPMSL